MFTWDERTSGSSPATSPFSSYSSLWRTPPTPARLILLIWSIKLQISAARSKATHPLPFWSANVELLNICGTHKPTFFILSLNWLVLCLILRPQAFEYRDISLSYECIAFKNSPDSANSSIGPLGPHYSANKTGLGSAMIQPQKEEKKKLMVLDIFLNVGKIIVTPTKSSKSAFPVRTELSSPWLPPPKGIKTTVDADRAWFMVWGSYSYWIIQVLRTYLLTFSYILIQDAS